MRSILRAIFLNTLTLYLVTLFYPGITIKQEIKTLISAAIIWWLLNKIVKPIIKLLLLPINLITLGLFSWAVNAITVFLLTVINKDVALHAYTFPGISYQGFIVPSISFNLIVSYVITSLVLYLTHGLIVWLLRP